MSKLDRDTLYPWLAILRAKFMGSSRARVLVERFGSINAALNASVEAIASVPRFNEEMGRAVREAARGKYDDEIERELNWCERNGVKIMLQSDPGFPEPLKQIPAAPALLYVKGKILPQDLLSIGIVGTRLASDAGKRTTNKIARELAEAGLTIVSGLAWGVDASAHKGALKCKTGRTLAVLGNGLKYIYPKEHKSLYEQVFRRGALITELFPAVAPDKRNFPPRNRIISGLSLGVLVAEAPARSGALITANYALEQGREIFALPGAVDQWNAEGANKLISDSAAKLVTSADDILRELEDKIAYYVHEMKGDIQKFVPPPEEPPIVIEDDEEPIEPEATEPPKQEKKEMPAAPTQKPAAVNLAALNLSDDENVILQKLTEDAVQIDALCRELDWPIARVSSALGLLELKGLADREAGMRFRKADG
ncbi:MAG: DNA-processing protein DprA [Candidatus Hinthialibacter antarcticus]|nr:DNA-processing protein DprA [Candidatus Hinthialibacter antarcticus]